MKYKHGTPIGRYQIVEEISHGAKGVVYSCRDASSKNHYTLAVLKNLIPSQEGEDESALCAGLESLKKLRHPNIVGIKELWRFDELLFLVTELPQAIPLSSYYDSASAEYSLMKANGRERMVKAAKIMREVASALYFAHILGMAHQDLRAEDILIRKDETPIILGFGWAHLLERTPIITENGKPRLPARYFGKQRDLLFETRKDVQAAGHIFYNLLTGEELKFQGRPLETYLCLRRDHRLSRAVRSIVLKATCSIHRRYSAGSFSKDLELLVSNPSMDRDYLGKEGQRTLYPRKGPTLKRKVITLLLLILVVSAALIGLFSQTLHNLTYQIGISQFKKDLAEIKALKGRVEPMESLTQLMDRNLSLPKMAPVRIELGRFYMEHGLLSQALKEFLVTQYLDPSLFVAPDLFELAERFYDCSHTFASDWCLNRIMEEYPNTEWSEKSLVLKKRLFLESNALERVTHSLKALLDKPPRPINGFRKELYSIFAQVESLSLKAYARKSPRKIFGDFLLQPGDEMAFLIPGMLVISGQDGDVEIPIHQEPLCFSSVDPDGPGEEKVLLGYPQGTVEIYDPIRGCLQKTFDLGFRIRDPILIHPGPNGTSQLVCSVWEEEGLSLVLLDCMGTHRTRQALFSSGYDSSLSALLSVDLFPHVPGEEILVFLNEARGVRIMVWKTRERGRGWEEVFQELYPLSIHHVLRMEGSSKLSPQVVLGVNTHEREGVLPGGIGTGVYRLQPAIHAKPGNGGEEILALAFKPLKVLGFMKGRGGVSITDSVSGDLDGNGHIDAVFLVNFPGWGAFEPDTRILVYRDGKDFIWLHAPEAIALDVRTLDPKDSKELMVDMESFLLGVEL